MMALKMNEVDLVEILTPQDNTINVASGDSNEVIRKAFPLKDGEFKNIHLIL
jgi:hypothetical protein